MGAAEVGVGQVGLEGDVDLGAARVRVGQELRSGGQLPATAIEEGRDLSSMGGSPDGSAYRVLRA